MYLYLFLLLSLVGLNDKEVKLFLKFKLMCFDCFICLLFLNYLILGCGFFFILYFKFVGLFFIIVRFWRGVKIFGVIFFGFLVVKEKI